MFPGYGSFTDHAQVSEREVAHQHPDGSFDDGAWEDCLWCSAIMFLRATGLAIPATHAEAERLRAASGEPPTGGSNFTNLRVGVARLYGLRLPDSIAGANAIWAAMTPGTVAILNGNMGAFLSGSYWRRWDNQFAGSHTVCSMRLDSVARQWWSNPQAPNAFNGEWIGEIDWRRYVGSYSAIVAPIGGSSMYHVSRPADGRILGRATCITDGTLICDTSDPANTRYPVALGAVLDVLAGPLEMTDQDIDGHSPPNPGRREVYLLDDDRDGSQACFGLVSNFSVAWAGDGDGSYAEGVEAEKDRMRGVLGL